MRAISPKLQSHLESGAVTVCRCWRIRRTDGVELGFTDHDEAVVFDGLTHSAMSGLASTGDVTRTGLGVGGLEIAGALSSAGLRSDDLTSGKYDAASVTLWLVNWQDVSQRVLLREGTLGEVTRDGGSFRAEVRGPGQALEVVRGRVFTHACDADLGDARCRVDLSALARNATVSRVDGTRIFIAGLGDLPTAHLSDGILRVTGGDDAGAKAAIATHALEGSTAVLRLRTPVLRLAAGDTVEVLPGCDKRFATCIGKFANSVNFQGFPHLPGNDRAFGYARGTA